MVLATRWRRRLIPASELTQAEARPDRPAYTPGESQWIGFGMNTTWWVSDRIQFFANLGFSGVDTVITRLAVRHGDRYCDVDSEDQCYGTFAHPCEFSDFRYGRQLAPYFPTCKSVEPDIELTPVRYEIERMAAGADQRK